MKKSQQCAFFGGVLILMHGVFAAIPGGEYVCKPSPWIYNNRATIVFRLDRINFDKHCVNGTTGQPVFRSSPDNQTVNYKLKCLVATDIRTSCSFTSGDLGCGCVNSNDNGFYVIEYNFIADPDNNRWWRAEISCIDNNRDPALSFSGTNCSNITGEMQATTTPPPPTTTTTITTGSTPDDCTFCDCNKDECTLCCFLCIVVIILCIIVGGFITTVIILYCCCREDVKTCAEKPGCRHCFCGALVALFVCMDKCSCNNGSTSSPEARNAGKNDKETNVPMTGDRKPDVDGKDEEDGAPSAGNRDNAVGSETRQKKKKKKNKQMEKQAADGDDMSPVAVSVTSSPEPTLVVQASSGRQLPQPHKAGTPETSTGREGAGKREETTLDQKPSHGKGSRPLPLPFEEQGNGTSTTTTTTTTTTSTTPRSLAPVRNPPPSSMPSVERNSFAERSGPSPSQE